MVFYGSLFMTGDLGQTYDSATTLAHYLESPGQTLLNVGDLSYADDYPLDYQVRWDTWSRFVERSAAYQPWIWTAGNHELEFLPEVVSVEYSLTNIGIDEKNICCLLGFFVSEKQRVWLLLLLQEIC